MVTKSPSPSPASPPNERTSTEFNATNWEMVLFEVETQTFYAPINKFKHAKMSPGKNNPVLAALSRTSSSAMARVIQVEDIGVTAEDFGTLLRIMYPPGYSHVETSPQTSTLSNENWISVLKISSLWFFQELRDLALRHLDKSSLSIMDRIVLGRAYNVPTWLSEGLCALADSHTSINSTMSDELGEKTTLRLHRIRDRRLLPEARDDTDNGVFSTTYSGVSDDVERAFSYEIEACEHAFKVYDTSFPGLTNISFPPACSGSNATKLSESIPELNDQVALDEPTVDIADSGPPISLDATGRNAETPVASPVAESYSPFSFGKHSTLPILKSHPPSLDSFLPSPEPASATLEPVQPTPNPDPLPTPTPLSEAVGISEASVLKGDLEKEDADSAARLAKPTEREKVRIGEEAVVRAARLARASLQPQKLTKAEKKRIRQEAIERAAQLSRADISNYPGSYRDLQFR